MRELIDIDGNRRLASRHGADKALYENRPFLLIGIILLMTIVIAAGTFAEPVWTGMFFAFFLAIVFFFLNLKIAVLVTIFIYIVSYRVVFQLQSSTKVFVEIIHIISFIIIITTYLVWLLRRVSGIERHNTANYLNTAVIFFMIWGACTLFWTYDIVHGVVLLFSMLLNLMMVKLFLVYFEDHKDYDRFMRFIVIAGLLLGLITFFSKWYLYEYTYGIPGTSWTFIAALGYDNYGSNPNIARAAGYATANQAAFMLNVFFFMILSKNFDAKLFREKIFYIALLFFLSGCVVLTGSKGAMISMVCGLCLILSLNTIIRMKRTAWFVVIAVLILTSVLLVYFLGENRVVKSVQSGKSGDLAYMSFSTRIEAWKNGFKNFDTPSKVLFGYGLGSSAAKANILPNMHSFYLSAMFDMGLIGLAFYLNILLTIIATLYKRIISVHSIHLKNILYCLAGALAASMINGLIFAEFDFHFFWILLAFIAGFTNKAFIYMQDDLTLTIR